jgi:hypothetical protein
MMTQRDCAWIVADDGGAQIAPIAMGLNLKVFLREARSKVRLIAETHGGRRGQFALFLGG